MELKARKIHATVQMGTMSQSSVTASSAVKAKGELFTSTPDTRTAVHVDKSTGWGTTSTTCPVPSTVTQRIVVLVRKNFGQQNVTAIPQLLVRWSMKATWKGITANPLDHLCSGCPRTH